MHNEYMYTLYPSLGVHTFTRKIESEKQAAVLNRIEFNYALEEDDYVEGHQKSTEQSVFS